MQKVKEISLAHYQGVTFSNEYALIYNTKMINIDLNKFWHSLPQILKFKSSTLQK